MSEGFTVKAFNEALTEGGLKGSKCMECGEIHLPPRPLCTKCGSTKLEWVELKGEGTLQALTEIQVPLTRFKESCPYRMGIVQLDEGPSMCGQIPASEGELEIGSRMEALFIREGEKTILGWKPV